MAAFYHLLVLSILSFGLHDIVRGACTPFDTPWKSMCEARCDHRMPNQIRLSECSRNTLVPHSARLQKNDMHVIFDDSNVLYVSRYAFLNSKFKILELKKSFEKFEPKSFAGLTLEDLQITNNMNLTSLSSEVFKGLNGLIKLKLVKNGLKSLPGDVFLGLGNITELDIRKNFISCFAEDLFHPMPGLKHLYISQNISVQMMGIGTKSFLGISADVHYRGEVDECVYKCSAGARELRLVEHGNPCECKTHTNGCEAEYDVVDECVPAEETSWTTMCKVGCEFLKGPEFIYVSECTGKSLPTPPYRSIGGSENLNVVFKRSGIETVPAFAFQGYTLSRLTLMNTFKNFQPVAFGRLSVTKLDIVYNPGLKSLVDGVFSDIKGLKEFTLGQHKIKSLPRFIFSPLHELTRLVLFASNFKCLARDLFHPLKSLEILSITQKNVPGLCANSFRTMGHLLSMQGPIDRCVIKCSEGVTFMDVTDTDKTCDCYSDEGCQTCEEYTNT